MFDRSLHVFFFSENYYQKKEEKRKIEIMSMMRKITTDDRWLFNKEKRETYPYYQCCFLLYVKHWSRIEGMFDTEKRERRHQELKEREGNQSSRHHHQQQQRFLYSFQ